MTTTTTTNTTKTRQPEQTEPTTRYLERPRYREALQEVDNVLGDLYFELQEIIGDVAVEGSFKEWADKQGVLLQLDELDLSTSDDPVLKDLNALHEHLDQVLRRLPRRLPVPTKQ